jgi:hypothetical protein
MNRSYMLSCRTSILDFHACTVLSGVLVELYSSTILLYYYYVVASNAITSY